MPQVAMRRLLPPFQVLCCLFGFLYPVLIYKSFIRQKLVTHKKTKKNHLNKLNVQLVYKCLSTAGELNTG